MKLKPKLAVEALEAREVPALFGNPWQNAQNLTLSFAQDGAAYSDQTWGLTASAASDLFSDLSGIGTAAWQEEILRALDTWASVANINVGVVADSGTAFGPAGLSPNITPATFRIGAVPLGSDVIALSTPNHPLAGGYSGTLVLNDTYTFSKNGASGTYDLYTVALHEFANVLGVADNDADYTSARYGHYLYPRTGINAGDAAAVQALYGARTPDAYEGATGNDTQATATLLTGAADPAVPGKTRAVATGDITAAGDADVYKFTVPSGTTSITVRLGTAGRSLLAGRIDVYDAAGNLVGSKSGTGPLQGDTVLTLAGLQSGGTYFVKVSGARADAFKTGSYQLRVGFGYDPVTETKVDTVQRFGTDGGTNNSLATATALAATPGYAANSHYDWTGRIESLSDTDCYRFVAPATGGPLTLTILSAAGLSTSATVYDAAGQVVAVNVLINWEGGMYRAQVANTTPGAAYTVRLQVQDPQWSATKGDYAATIDFSQPLALAQTIASGVAYRNSQIAIGIDVQETGGFRFNFKSTTPTAAVEGALVFIYDATGRLAAVVGSDGTVVTQYAELTKGKYTVLIQPIYSGNSSAAFSYTLGISRISDPIDPYAPADPTSPPPPPPPPPPPTSGGDLEVSIITPPWLPWLPGTP